MLWETNDPAEVLWTRFGHRDAESAARWIAGVLREHWDLSGARCEQIVMSSHNALAWVTTSTGPMVVKWSVAASRFPRLEALAQLTVWLGRRGLPVSGPMTARDGRVQVEVDGVSMSLQRRIRGDHLDTDDLARVREAGVALAQLHGALTAYPFRIPDLTGPTAPLSRQILDWLESGPDQVPGAAQDGLRRLVAHTVPGDLPTQLVHGDYRSANILVEDSRIVAVLDFEEARIDYRITELARSAVLLGTRFHDWGPVSADVHAALLDGYQSRSRLSATEASWWKPLVLWFSLTMAPVAGESSLWISSALDQLRSGTDRWTED